MGLVIKRNQIINKNLLNKFILIHNGKIFIKTIVNKNMIGLKAGCFSFTRSKFKFKTKK